MCLVEVVDVEHERPLGRSVHAEIDQVRVSAELHDQIRARSRSQIRGHDRCGSAERGERIAGHPGMSQRQ